MCTKIFNSRSLSVWRVINYLVQHCHCGRQCLSCSLSLIDIVLQSFIIILLVTDSRGPSQSFWHLFPISSNTQRHLFGASLGATHFLIAYYCPMWSTCNHSRAFVLAMARLHHVPVEFRNSKIPLSKIFALSRNKAFFFLYPPFFDKLVLCGSECLAPWWYYDC